MKCFSCRLRGAPWSRLDDGGRWKMLRPCCAAPGTDGAEPDVTQWLRTRAVKVAWLIRAARHIPGLTVKERP